MGELGAGKSGSLNGKSNLAAASTTLGGASSLEPTSNGVIAGEGGKPGYSVGSAIGGTGEGATGGADFGTLNLGAPEVSGGLDRETVRRIIMQYRGQIRTCYERALLIAPQLAGRVTLNWTISPSGPVIKAQIKSSTSNSPSLDGCVKDVIKSMAFPAAQNGRPTTVIYPFIFQARS
jgi:TonB family protein